MIHIYRHQKGKLKGKFDFATIRKNNYVSGSDTQGYERKQMIFKTVASDLKEIAKHSSYLGELSRLVQDDSVTPSVVWSVSVTGKHSTVSKTMAKPKSAYSPSQR